MSVGCRKPGLQIVLYSDKTNSVVVLPSKDVKITLGICTVRVFAVHVKKN